MTLKFVRCCVLVFFLVYLVAVIWPIATLVSTAKPMIVGLPLSMAWAIAWILLGLVALLILDRFESREKDRNVDPDDHEGRDLEGQDREDHY